MGSQAEEVSFPLLDGVDENDLHNERSRLNNMLRMLHPISTWTMLGWM